MLFLVRKVLKKKPKPKIGQIKGRIKNVNLPSSTTSSPNPDISFTALFQTHSYSTAGYFGKKSFFFPENIWYYYKFLRIAD